MLPVTRISKASSRELLTIGLLTPRYVYTYVVKYVYSLCVGTSPLWVRTFSDMTFAILMARQVRSQQTLQQVLLGMGKVSSHQSVTGVRIARHKRL